MAQYHEPRSVAEAVALLARHGEARCLAGGATLVAMINADLARPEVLVSLRRIPGLAGIAEAGEGWLRIGAMTRHRDTAAAEALTGGRAILRLAAGRIANPVVRNMGTIGGSISFADPAADYPPALVAAAAEIEATGPTGTRRIAAGDFFCDWYTTALAADEMVTAVWLPPSPPGTVAIYDKLVKVEGDMGIATVAVVLIPGGEIRVVVGACGPTPVRLDAAEAALRQGGLSGAAIAEAGRLLAAALDPVDDVRASAEYRRRVVPRMVARAVGEARAKLEASR